MEKKVNILIIDDDADFKIVLTKYLQNFNIHVEVAEDGLDGIFNAATRKRPDLIILDIKMRNVDGIETYNMLNENKDLRDIPVIFASGEVDSDYVKEFVKANKICFLPKPFEFSELLKLIQELTELKL